MHDACSMKKSLDRGIYDILTPHQCADQSIIPNSEEIEISVNLLTTSDESETVQIFAKNVSLFNSDRIIDLSNKNQIHKILSYYQCMYRIVSLLQSLCYIATVQISLVDSYVKNVVYQSSNGMKYRIEL